MNDNLNSANHDRVSQAASHLLIEQSEIIKQFDKHRISQERQDNFFQILRCLTYDGWEG